MTKPLTVESAAKTLNLDPKLFIKNVIRPTTVSPIFYASFTNETDLRAVEGEYSDDLKDRLRIVCAIIDYLELIHPSHMSRVQWLHSKQPHLDDVAPIIMLCGSTDQMNLVLMELAHISAAQETTQRQSS